MFRYGEHLSKEDVDALVAPHPSSLSIVESWLTDHGIDTSDVQHSGASSWLTVVISVGEAERMLNAKYNTYFSPSTSSYVVRTLGYFLPRELHPHVDVIYPTTYFNSMKKMKATSFVMPNVAFVPEEVLIPGEPASSCASVITPECLRTLYNSSTYKPAAVSQNKLGIAGYLDEYANEVDLQVRTRSGYRLLCFFSKVRYQMFFNKYRTDAKGAKFEAIEVNGGLNDQNDPGIEACVVFTLRCARDV